MILTQRAFIGGITSKRVTSGGIHLRGLAPGKHSFEETSPQCQVGDTVSDLTCPGIKRKTFRMDSEVLNDYVNQPVKSMTSPETKITIYFFDDILSSAKTS